MLLTAQVVNAAWFIILLLSLQSLYNISNLSLPEDITDVNHFFGTVDNFAENCRLGEIRSIDSFL